MIVAHSSVWIGLFRDQDSRQVAALEQAACEGQLLLLDIVLLEVLRGATTQSQAVRIEQAMDHLPTASTLGVALARTAARNYRSLRARGITLLETADLIVGTYCIENGHMLLHADRDFDPMTRHLNLRIA